MRALAVAVLGLWVLAGALAPWLADGVDTVARPDPRVRRDG